MAASTIPLFKRCSKCAREYPATPQYFFRNQDRLRSICKECYRLARIPKTKRRTLRRKDELRQCSRCERWLPNTVEYFRPRGDDPKRFRSHCRDCLNESERQWRKTPNAREKYRYRLKDQNVRARWHVNSRKYRQKPEVKLAMRIKESKRRALKRNTEDAYTKDDVHLQFKAQGGNCWWCGAPLNENFHIDHRIPLAKGGKNNAGNIVLAHPHCNLSKGAKTLGEWNGRLL